MQYNITLSEDSKSGTISVTNVEKIVKVNQYRSDTRSMPNSTFTVSRKAIATKMRKATARPSSKTKSKRNRKN